MDTLPNVNISNVWYEGEVTEGRNIYHCDPCVTTKLFNLLISVSVQSYGQNRSIHIFYGCVQFSSGIKAVLKLPYR